MRNFAFIAALVSLLVVAPFTAAQAGQLFPPANLTGTAINLPCPNNEVLTWSGDSVVCVDPTLAINVSCPEGTVMTGISGGSAVCTQTASTCPSGQTLVNGVCTTSTSSSSSPTSPSFPCPSGQMFDVTGTCCAVGSIVGGFCPGSGGSSSGMCGPDGQCTPGSSVSCILQNGVEGAGGLGTASCDSSCRLGPCN